MKNFGIYCSGGASRVLKYYNKFKFSKHPVKFIIYDGPDKSIWEELKKIDLELEVVHFQGSSSSTYNYGPNISDALLNISRKYDIDYIFCFGNRILSGKLLQRYKNKIINFHPSILPAFPGLNSIDKALKTSVQVLGNTAHFIDEGIDSGPIIMQAVIPRHCVNELEDVLGLQLEMLKKIREIIDRDELTVENNVVCILNNNVNKNLFSYE